jgi:peptidoglycan/LPS O-acetylase OafA/YrhL
LRFWGDPVVLEFVGGMAVATALREGVAASNALRITAALAGLGWLAFAPGLWPEANRALHYGPGAMLLVAAATLGPEPRMPQGLVRWALVLGDSSYALYLLHPFPLRILQIALRWLGLHSLPALIAYCALGLALSVAGAVLVHKLIERPLTLACRRLFGEPRRFARGDRSAKREIPLAAGGFVPSDSE